MGPACGSTVELFRELRRICFASLYGASVVRRFLGGRGKDLVVKQFLRAVRFFQHTGVSPFVSSQDITPVDKQCCGMISRIREPQRPFVGMFQDFVEQRSGGARGKSLNTDCDLYFSDGWKHPRDKPVPVSLAIFGSGFFHTGSPGAGAGDSRLEVLVWLDSLRGLVLGLGVRALAFVRGLSSAG